jgi:predicted glycoside hydrolase/deacetylase ChbG (UPF0249 family)
MAVTLIVNGDDFGVSPAVNAAILHCHCEGVLTSTSVLANGAAADEALGLARAHPSMGVGVHLNLTDGAPLSSPAAVPTLVDRQGRFRTFPGQMLRVIGGRARIAEVERELRAQIEYVLARGVVPTHVDGHLHAHAYPRLLPLVLRLMHEYGIRGMRQPILAAWMPLYPEARRAARRSHVHGRRHSTQRGAVRRHGAAGSAWASVTTGFSRRGRKAALLAHHGVIASDCLLDAATLLAGADPAAALSAALRRVGGATVELMSHPGFADDAARGAAEVALLTAPHLRALLESGDVRRVHFGQVADRY